LIKSVGLATNPQQQPAAANRSSKPQQQPAAVKLSTHRPQPLPKPWREICAEEDSQGRSKAGGWGTSAEGERDKSEAV
jgi:hypothetical protein